MGVSLARASVTKYHRLGDLVLELWRPESKVEELAAWSLPAEASLLVLQRVVFSVCSDILFSIYSVRISLRLYKDQLDWIRAHHFMTSFHLNYFL